MPPRTSSRGTTRKATAAKSIAKPTNIVFHEPTEPDMPDVAEMRPTPKRKSIAQDLDAPMEPVLAPAPPVELRKTVTSHETVISVMTILFVCFMLAAVLTGYIHTVQIDGLSRGATASEESQLNMQRNIVNMQSRVEAIDQRVTNLETRNEVATSTLPVTTSSTTQAAAVQQAAVVNALPVAGSRSGVSSPDGKLVRGSLSPDGTKFAGFDVTSSKRGVAVEVLSEDKVRHLVIFNPAIQSSGLGLPEESSMSVRWKDDSTIEYDMLIKNADGTRTPKVETIKINF